MPTHPTFIDLTSPPFDVSSSQGLFSPRDLHSPRIHHLDGDIPPTMSPLDAFAAQSRLLAKQLEETKRANGRRVSRLPPFAVASSLAKPMPVIVHSEPQSTDAGTPEALAHPHEDESTGYMTHVPEPTQRPVSFYPTLSQIPAVKHEKAEPSLLVSKSPLPMTPVDREPQGGNDYFDIPRSQSPDAVVPFRKSLEEMKRSSWVLPHRSFDSSYRNTDRQRGLSTESYASQCSSNGLAPPKSPHVRYATSLRSVPVDSSDDENSASTGESGFSRNRNTSASSGISMPQSPLSPFVIAHARSPSLNSEYSLGGARQVNSSLNFSRPGRPVSRGSRPSFDVSSRQPSTESQSYAFGEDGAYLRASTENESLPPLDTAAPSYIYSKYSLPRGRVLKRNSEVLTNMDMPQFEGHQTVVSSRVTPATPPTDDKPPSSSTLPNLSNTSRPMTPESISTDTRYIPSRPPPFPNPNPRRHDSSASFNSGSTIKARPNRKPAPSTELTAEDHLAKGIERHEHGSFSESTYHLRIAAKQNNPTAMLLYALACRHGWGIRPNPTEGVKWLRKAADCASLEIQDDPEALSQRQSNFNSERKARQAQFALSIYELGVSHMNGWGIEQDKALALRCFEIASSWGDTDATAEAGFCYAQGVGCRKDLKKAARLYRLAEAKGMSMVGNSWIYKPKYADRKEEEERTGRETERRSPEKKGRDKSRTKTITLFGRKRSMTVKN